MELTYIGLKIFVLLAMIFFHIIDDYKLQGILASMKQKSFWEENAPEPMYKHDYIVALITHGFSWSFMMMLPAVIYVVYAGCYLGDAYTEYRWMIALYLFICNIIIHAIVDNMKANKKEINLVDDQLMHLVQIVFSWFFIVVV